MNTKPYSYWLVKLFLHQFKTCLPYADEMFNLLEDESANINARIAAALMLWNILPEPPDFDDYNRLYYFIDCCVAIQTWAERHANSTYPTELNHIIPSARSHAHELEREAQADARERRWMQSEYQYQSFFAYR